MSTPYRLLIFDWDGTLSDSVAHIVTAMRQALQEEALTVLPEATIKSVIGLGLPQALQHLQPDITAEQRQALGQRYRRLFYTQNRSTHLFAGAETVLRTLATQYALAIATGKSTQGLQDDLLSCGLDSLFQQTRCAEQTRSKPHPQMLLEILAAMAIPVSQAVMIGDSRYDMEMAHCIGMDRVAVGYGVESLQALRHWQPQGCLDDIQQLPDWLLAAAATD